MLAFEGVLAWRFEQVLLFDFRVHFEVLAPELQLAESLADLQFLLLKLLLNLLLGLSTALPLRMLHTLQFGDLHGSPLFCTPNRALRRVDVRSRALANQ